MNSRIVGNYLIVETIASKWTMRIGDEYVCVRKKKKNEMDIDMNVLKVVIAFVILISILLIWAYFATPDTSLDNSLENIDDTKFPISDYLYFERIEQDKQNNLNIPINNNSNMDLDVTNENPQISNFNVDSNITSQSNNTTNNTDNGINNLSDKELGSDTKKLTNEIFNEELDPLLKQQRNILLSSRNGGIAILNKAKNNKKLEYGVDKFSNLNEQDKASNEHKLYRTISAMKMIPAILITNISSDIGGKVIAQVEEYIYAEMGKAILIPKGSKVLGNYANNNKIGEYRLNILWTRILTPQGVNIMLTDAYGADLAGAMGLIGDLDSKYYQRYGIPLALSTISNGLILTINNVTSKYSNQNPYTTTQLIQNMQGDLSQIMSQIIREQVKIRPTIRIEKGSRIFITSNKDIFFPIPKNNEVMTRFFNEIKLNMEE
ncbi:MAG: DNA type IV secretion system protein ComB10 [Helicobacteraceae bacterium]|nr:DNA type IV secretion system protein ComB10 [Helicobacteraceae bacterium]